MSEAKDRALSLMEAMVKQNGNLIEMASRITDPSERIKALDKIEKQIDRNKKILKELK